MQTLEYFRPFLAISKALILRDVIFENEEDFKKALENHDRLVIAIRHGSPLSWWPLITAIANQALEWGQGDRVPVGVMDRNLHKLPVFNKLADYIAQGAPKSFDEAYAVMDHYNKADFIVFPEGSNCFFGRAEDVQDFRSLRFIEMAKKLEAPVLMVNHSGSEDWSVPLDLSPYSFVFGQFDELLPKSFIKNGILGIPKIPKPVEEFHVWTELLVPSESGNIEEDAARVREFFQDE